MKVEISKDQCMRMAEAEGDCEIGAGTVGHDPGFPNSRWLWFRTDLAWRVRCVSYWMQEHHIPGWKLVFRLGVRI